MTKRSDPPIRVSTEILEALRKFAKTEGTGISEQANRILIAGFNSLYGNSAARELDAAHQELTSMGVQTHMEGRTLAVSARIRLLKDMAELAVIKTLMNKEGSLEDFDFNDGPEVAF